MCSVSLSEACTILHLSPTTTTQRSAEVQYGKTGVQWTQTYLFFADASVKKVGGCWVPRVLHSVAFSRGQMILNGVVAVGHNDDTDSDSAAWQRAVEHYRAVSSQSLSRCLYPGRRRWPKEGSGFPEGTGSCASFSEWWGTWIGKASLSDTCKCKCSKVPRMLPALLHRPIPQRAMLTCWTCRSDGCVSGRGWSKVHILIH